MIRLIQRHGNKDNDIKFFKSYLPIDCIMVVEPFAGSFAVSSKCYSDIKYKVHINDTDEALFWIYTNYNEFIKTRIEINDISKFFFTDYKEKINIFKNSINNLTVPDCVKEYLINMLIIRGSMIKTTKNTDFKKSDIEIMKKATKTNIDYIEILEMYKDDKDAFIFLDPPYMFSDNSAYSKTMRAEKMDNTDMVYIIKKYMDISKCKIMLIINDLKIIRFIFGDMVKGEYNKVYQMAKKKAVHLIITNYNL